MSERLLLKPPPSGPSSLGEAQVIQRVFEYHVVGPENMRPATRVERFIDEACEVGQMMEGKTRDQFDKLCYTEEGFRKAVAMEAMDSIIVALGVIDSLGYDAQNLFNIKMNINFQKYSIKRMSELRSQGLNEGQAQIVMKKEWNEMYPKDTYGNSAVIYEPDGKIPLDTCQK